MKAMPSRGRQSLIQFGPACIVLAVLLVVAGCRESARHPAPSGTVQANEAYEYYFGEPPEGGEGTCFARVGFFPLTADPDRVRPVPLFIFRPEGQLAHLLEGLAAVARELPPHSGLRNPFPPGSSARVTAQTGESVTVDLAGPGVATGSPDFQGLAASVAETALQFEDIERVVITVAGEPLPEMPPEGFGRNPERIAPAGPPLPLMVVGDWERGGEDPVEIRLGFDRPVDVHDIRLFDAEGREIAGEYFRTGFDMIVALHPTAPQDLRPGMTVRAAWRVSDRRGRESRGEQDFVLARHDLSEDR